MTKNFHPLAIKNGGYENLIYTEKDYLNYMAKARQFRLGVEDVKALGNYFLSLQWRNSNLFHLIDMDEEGHLRNEFWADAGFITTYVAFSDLYFFTQHI